VPPTSKDTMTLEQHLQTIEEAVLSAIRERPSAPRVLELLDLLRDRYSTADLQLALAELLHQGQIELTSERVLRAAA
jgi:hypothetical protein